MGIFGRIADKLEDSFTGMLRTHSQKTDREGLLRAYPGSTPDESARRRIEQTARRAILSGAFSGLVISLAELEVVTSLFGLVTAPAILIGIPIVAAAFVLEIWFTLRMQVRLVYDLFLIYGLPIDLEDTSDVWRVFAIALNIRSGQTISQGLKVILPNIVQQEIQRTIKDDLIVKRVRGWVTRNVAAMVAQRYVGGGFLLKVLAPGLNIIFGAAWNYFTTRGIGNGIMGRVRQRETVIRLVDGFDFGCISDGDRLLSAILGIAMADGGFHDHEILFYKAVASRLKASTVNEAEIRLDWKGVLEELKTVKGRPEQRAILDLVEHMAAVDGKVGHLEMQRVKQVAALFGLESDEKAAKNRAAPYAESHFVMNCLVALGVFLAVAVTVLVCLCGVLYFGAVFGLSQLILILTAPLTPTPSL